MGHATTWCVLWWRRRVWDRIVFLRHPQASHRIGFVFPEGESLAVSLTHFFDSQHYPGKITFLPVVATSSFHPYLESCVRREREREERCQSENRRGDGRQRERKRQWRDRQIRGRLKIIQGSTFTTIRFSRADVQRVYRTQLFHCRSLYLFLCISFAGILCLLTCCEKCLCQLN